MRFRDLPRRTKVREVAIAVIVIGLFAWTIWYAIVHKPTSEYGDGPRPTHHDPRH